MRHFCTYFDSNYLPRARCLIDSLSRHCDAFTIHALCHDDKSVEIVTALNIKNVAVYSIEEIESQDKDLVTLRGERSLVEYYYTVGPSFIWHVLTANNEIETITYLDADLYFYSDPGSLFDDFCDSSIGVTPHRLRKYRNKHVWQGTYNVGWINFRKDRQGMECLAQWRDDCKEWCYERFEDGKYADQLYLDSWPLNYSRFIEYDRPGANVAPWNLSDYKLSTDDGGVKVDGEPLIFFHFHGLRKISNNIYNTSLGFRLRFPPFIFKKYILEEYLNKLNEFSISDDPTQSVRRISSVYSRIKLVARRFLGLIFREYVLFVNGRVY